MHKNTIANKRKHAPWSLALCACAVLLAGAGCDTPGESGALAGLAGGLVGGYAGGSAGSMLVGAAAAGLTTYAIQSSYEASQAQKEAAKARAEAALAKMDADSKAKAKKILVPVEPTTEHPEANQVMVYDPSTGQVNSTVNTVSKPLEKGKMAQFNDEQVYVAG